ncbi:OLC1v1030207C1 [Oldenlandia corymbosa var. corymbosa]|uniref:OLC1v1030207C1 n=1 Tax=Oldenlandia corymbosa var. corymbosa TaxID=529605 RepID=A0AAV1CGA9_OLDCO|nr:OLC1v1030207C1 [Oldenlandia corymbosa var. corymbosa]
MEGASFRASSARLSSSNIWRNSGMDVFSRSSVEYDDEEALKWAAIEKLPTYLRIRRGIWTEEQGSKEIDVENLGEVERRNLVERLVKIAEEDNEKFLLKLKKRMDRVGISLPTIEVRFEHLNIEAQARASGRALPTMFNFTVNMIEGFLDYLYILPSRKKKLTILRDVSGIIKPGRMTLLLGPPSSGKTTLLLALAGKSDSDLKVSGRVTYNGHEMNEFVPERTSAYISQYDLHMGELTVRETLAFSARCQGVGPRYDMLVELSRREKEANIKPDPDIDMFMKAASLEGQEASVVTDYVLKVLGLEICADTLVGDEMIRGISGGQRKRVTTGEMMVGPARALFMDEISTGLDSSTTFQIVNAIRQSIHILEGTTVISLLQPAPETYDLFDDVILLSDGEIVYQGPRENVLEFFEYMGFKCPERKAVADFLQEVTSRKDQEQYWARRDEPYNFITSREFSEAFQSFHVGRRLGDELAVPFDKSKSHPAALTTKRFGASKKELLKACTAREFLLMKRNSFVYIFKMTQLITMAFLAMTVFLRTDMHKKTVTDGGIYVGALFFSVCMVMFNGFSELALSILKLPVFYKQRDLLFFPAWAYSLPTWILKIPITFAEAAIWLCMTYYTIGFDSDIQRFFRHFLLLVFINQVASGLFRFIAGVGRNVIVANTAGSCALVTVFVLGGFILSKDEIKKWWIWGFWFSPMTYAQNAICINEFLGKSWNHVPPNGTEPLGVSILKSRGLFTEAKWYWIGVGALIGHLLLFNFLFTLALTYLNPFGKSRSVVPNENSERSQDSRKNSLSKLPSRQKSTLEMENLDGSVSSRSLSSRVGSRSETNRTRRGMVLPFEPLSITFDDIRYAVDMPMEMKAQGFTEDRLELLKGVSGAFRPGVLTALMGVSGAGKTTLMDVLAGRKTGGYIEGQICISGYPKKQETFARIAGYCEQTDIHSPHVTVHESLTYSAWLRLPPEVDDATRKMFVEEVMELIELTPLRDSLVGLPGVNGLSTEQRKRLTVAVELVANPSIIFMDEPTSGLDARAAAIVMRTVRNTVDTGRTVVCTIHQPSIDIFDAFDELLLLKRGGEEIYVGPLGRHSSNLIKYFEDINGISKIRDGYNPATWMLEITSAAQEVALGINFSEVYKSSDLYRRNKELIKELSKPAPGSKDLYFPTQYSQSFLTQCIACLWKQHLSYWRNPAYSAVRFLFTSFIAIMFGTIFWNIGSKRKTKQDIFNAMGSMYAAVLFLGVQNATSVQPVVAIERTVFYRERAAGMYSALPYAFGQIPYNFVQTLIYGVIVYAMIGFDWTIAKFLCILRRMEPFLRIHNSKNKDPCLVEMVLLHLPVTLDSSMILNDSKEKLSKFEGSLKSFDVECQDFKALVYNLLTSSIPTNLWEVEELVNIMDSILDNLRDLLQFKTYESSEFESYVAEAHEDLEENVRFLKNFILFAMSCVGLGHKEMEDLLTHAEGLVASAARLNFMSWCIYCPKTHNSFSWYDNYPGTNGDISSLIDQIKPIKSHVFGIYVGVLQASKLSLGSSPRSHTLNMLADFVDSLLVLAWDRLFCHHRYTGILDNEVQRVYEVLRYLRTFLLENRNQLVEQYKVRYDLIGIVISEAGIIVCYLFRKEFESRLEKKIGVLVLDLEEKFKLIKPEEETLIYLQMSASSLPQTNLPAPGFVHSALAKLEAFGQSQTKMPRRNKRGSVASAKAKLQTVHDDLAFLRSFLPDDFLQYDQDAKLQDLWSRFAAVAYDTEFILDSLVAGNTVQSLIPLLNTVLEEIKLMKAEVLENSHGKRQITNVHDVTKPFGKRPLTGEMPISDDPVVGLDDEAQKIIDRLKRGTRQLDVVSIAGMPGLGKTTLGRKVYCDPSVVFYFYVRSWSPVSQEYNKRNLFLEILGGFVSILDKHLAMNENDLAEELYKSLKGKRYLIVLDDIWDIDVWNSLRTSFPNDVNGSRILLTTRHHNLALQIKSDSEPHCLRLLTNDESWELLRKRIKFEEDCCPKLLALGMEIAHHCKGLPLMILIVAGILSNMGPDTWEEVARSLRQGAISITEQCRETLELSYRYLPDHLKSCFLYFGAFQEDQKLPVRKLLWLWIAEGFVQKTEKDGLEDVVKGYLMELIQRSLVMVVEKGSRGRIKSCVLHDILLDFCKAKCDEEHFLRCLHGVHELHTSTEPCILNDYRLHVYSRRDDSANSRLLCPRVRSLFFSADYERRHARHRYDIFCRFCESKLLRVVDLRIHAGQFFPRVIEQLVHLRYLALATEGSLTIPSSVDNLLNLEAFIVEGRNVKVWLPDTIWNMKNLRHLVCINGSFGDLKLPRGNLKFSPCLENLETLSSITFTSRETMEDNLRRFPNIRRLKCHLITSDKCTGECKILALDFMSQLESVSLSQRFETPHNCHLQFPKNLKKLVLSNFNLPWSKISAIDELPVLEVLKLLDNAYKGKTWDMEEGKFPKLRFLKLVNLDFARWTGDSDDNFPCLEKVVLEACRHLNEVPSCLAYISTLQMIEVSDCKSVASSIKQIQEEQMDMGNEDLKPEQILAGIMVRNSEGKTVLDFVSTIDSVDKVMSSSNAGSRLFAVRGWSFATQLNEADSLRLISAASTAYLVQLRKFREDLATARAERDEVLFEVVTLEEKERQVQVKEAEIVEVQVKYNELEEKMRLFASLQISKEELHQWSLEEMNLVAPKCGAYRVGVVGLKRLDQDRPIKAKWFKQLLLKDPKKTMHEAMITSFPGDVPAVLAKGPSEEDPIPEVPDEYMGIELEDTDEETEEDVADTSHSGVQRTIEDASQAPSKDPSNDPLQGSDAESWTVHRVHHMVLSEEQSREFPLYSMISGILRSRADVHSLEMVAHLENDLLDAMRTHNVKVNQHLINEIKGLREEMQRREVQSLKDHSDSLTFEVEIHDELVTLEKENARLRARQQITVSPWFLEKHQVLALQHMIMVRTRRFIAAMDILKERSREIELLTDYIAQLQNLLLDNNINFEAFEHPEETVDHRTRSSREELLMRVHAQDIEIVDLKDKLNQCVNLLSLHGYEGIIHPSPDNPVREVLVIL